MSKHNKSKARKNIFLISIVISLLMISFFVQVSFVQSPIQIINDSGSNEELPASDEKITIDSASTYNITDIEVTKTETISVEVNPRGVITSTTAQVNIEIENKAQYDVVLDFMDRVEGGKEDSFYALLDTPQPNLTTIHDILFINWTNIYISANNKTELEYLVQIDKEIPIELEVHYYINETIPVVFGNDTEIAEIDCPVGSNLSASITIRAKNNSFFGTSGLVNPILLAIITALFPAEGFGEISSNLPILMQTDISFTNQISWGALVTNETVLNWSVPILDGGGWGIIELEPLTVSLIFSSDLFSALFSGVSLLLGLQTGLEGFWSYLTIESMLDQFIVISNLIEVLIDIMVTDMGLLNSIMYSALGSLDLFAMEPEDLLTIGDQNGSIFSLIKLDRLYNFIEGVDDDQFESLIPLRIDDDLVNWNSKENILAVIDEIKAGIISSIGAQLISILGNPVNVTYSTTNATRIAWNSSKYDGYNLTDIIYTSGLNVEDDNLTEIAVSMYCEANDTSLLVVFEYDSLTENYTEIWRSSDNSTDPSGGPSDTRINGKIEKGCLQAGDLDSDDDSEIIIGTDAGYLTVFEFSDTYEINYYGRHDSSQFGSGISSVLVSETNMQTDEKSIIFGLNNGSIFIVDISGTDTNLLFPPYHQDLSIVYNWNKSFGGKITDIKIGNTDNDDLQELLFYNTSHLLIYENITVLPSFNGLYGLWNLSIDLSQYILNDMNYNGTDDIIYIGDNTLNVSESIIHSETIVVSPTNVLQNDTILGYNASVWGENVYSIIDNSTNLIDLEIGDLNEDGRIEIITGFENGTIHLYQWSGQEFYKEDEYTHPKIFGSKGFVTGDINHNGHPDLILLGNDSRIHFYEDLYTTTSSLNIFTNLSRNMNDNSKTDLYTIIKLDNFLVNISGVTLTVNEEYVYNGDGPSVMHLGMEVSENVTSYNSTLITINRTIVNTESAHDQVVVYDDSDEYSVDQITYWNDKTNITTEDLGAQHANVTVNYTYYLIVDPIFGYNLTTFPPYNYSNSITKSNYPAIYPFLLEMLSTSQSSLIKMIGNLTASLAKQYLMLNATFSDEIALGSDKPIALLSGFDIMDLFSLFNSITSAANSPFGNPVEQQLGGSMTQLGGMTIPTFDMGTMLGENGTISDMSFESLLQIFLEPNLQSRFLYNVTIPGNFSEFADSIYLPYPNNITIQGEGLSMQTLPSFEGGVEIFGNATIATPTSLSLKLNPLLVTDVDNNGVNDTIIVVNGFYPNYNIYCINNTNEQVAWNVSLLGPVESMELDSSTNQLALVMRNPDANVTNGDSELMVSKLFIQNGIINPEFNYLEFTYNNSLKVFFNDTYVYTGEPSYEASYQFINISSYSVSLKPQILPDNRSIFVIDNSISLYDGNVTGQYICYNQPDWIRELTDVIEYCEIADLNNDGEVEIIVGTISGYIFALNLDNTIFWQFRADGKITDLEIEDINGDNCPDVILSSVDKNLYVLNSTNRALLIKYEAKDIINDLSISDFDEDGNKDIVFGSSDKFIYVIDSNGQLIWDFNTSYHHNTMNEYVKSVELAYLNNNENLSIFYGAGDNKIKIVDVSNNETTYEKYIGHYVASFQLYRTNESISLQFDLDDPIFSMLSAVGELNMDSLLAMIGSGSATAGAMLGSGFSLDLESLLGDAGGMDLGIDLTQITGLLPSGIGLMNLALWKLNMIMSLSELSSVMAAQHEFTGQCEVRGSNDFVNPSEYYNVTQIKNVTTNLTRYEIESINETANMQVNYLYVILSDDNSQNNYVNESRIKFWVWNGSEYVNLQNNSIYNLSLAMLDIEIVHINNSQGNYTEIRFRPFLSLIPLQERNISVDWNNRVIYFNITGDYNETYWIDVSYLHPNVVYGMTMTTIGHSLMYPVIVVFEVRTPYIDNPPDELPLIIQMVSSPFFYIFLIAASVMLLELTYFKRRGEAQLDKVAGQNLSKWLTKRRKSWDILAENGLLYEKQYQTLKNFRHRITEATREKYLLKVIRTKFEKHKFLSQALYAVFLKDFWNEFGKRNRIGVIFDEIVDFGLNILKKIASPFLKLIPKSKSAKAREEELKKKVGADQELEKDQKKSKQEKLKKEKALKDDLIKDIESKLKRDIDSLKKTAVKKKKFKKPDEKKWKGEFKNDGGGKSKETLIRVRKKLPDFFTEEGKIFYKLSKNRYIGTTTGELAKFIDKKVLETIPILIKLYEKGLIILLQEGEFLSEDLWDVAASLRKSDPDIEKMLYTTKFLDETLNKTITELKEEKKSLEK